MHHGRLGPRGEHDEVAKPPFELLEDREELVPLRTSLGPPDALLASRPESSSVVTESSALSLASPPRSVIPASSVSAASPASNSGSR